MQPFPGQPAHHPAPALSQPIHLRAMPSFQVSWEFSSSHNPWCSSHPTTSAGLGTNCYHLLLCGIQCSGWQRLLYDSLEADDNADFYVISFTWEWHKMSTYTLFLSNRRNQYLQNNRIFNPCSCLFKWKLSRLHRGILIFRETVTIPQFSHLSKSFIKTSWNQQVWAENPRH